MYTIIFASLYYQHLPKQNARSLETKQYMNPDIPSDLPTQVKIPSASVTQPLTVSNVAASPSEPAKVRAVLKYRNYDGRESILAVAKNVHHDFGEFNSTLAVSLSPADLETIKKNPNVDWFEGDGRVIYCSIR